MIMVGRVSKLECRINVSNPVGLPMQRSRWEKDSVTDHKEIN